MNCPICDSKLERSHTAEDFYINACIQDNEHYTTIFNLNKKTKKYEQDTETFKYDDVTIQKIFYRYHADFYWGIRSEEYHPYDLKVKQRLILSQQEFITKFGEFNPKDISSIRERLDLLDTFS